VADILSSSLGVICVGRRVGCERSGEDIKSMALVRAIIAVLIREITAALIREITMALIRAITAT
jgi:hypothetical protein